MRLKNTLTTTSLCIGIGLILSGCETPESFFQGSSARQSMESTVASSLTNDPTVPETTDDNTVPSVELLPSDALPLPSEADLTSEADPIDTAVLTATADTEDSAYSEVPAVPGDDSSEPTAPDAADDSATADPSAPDNGPVEPTGDDNSPADPSSSAEPTSAQNPGQTISMDGWVEDYREDFNGTLDDAQWEAYGWHRAPVGDGGMGIRAQENAFTRDGNLILQTKFENNEWTSGGTSTGNVFTASQGRWEVRAKFPNSEGLGYCFLLWPADEGWPPEIDFAEGSATNPEISGTYHWDPDNKQEQRKFQNPDMGGWHTYGVIVEDNVIIFTLDGQETARIEQDGITDKEMFLGMQAAPLDPNGVASRWETTVEGGVPNDRTPAVSEIEIDWVAHYAKG